MHKEEKDLYYVAVKVFLEKEGKFLILRDGFGEWDIPGGRIKKSEFEAPLENIVERKMTEELGSGFTYILGKPIIHMRHERVEAVPGNPTVHIFAIGYQAELEKGDVVLSSHHKEMLWVDSSNFIPEDYFTGGWLQGVKEYIRFKQV